MARIYFSCLLWSLTYVLSGSSCCYRLMPKLLKTCPLWRATDDNTSEEWFQLFEFKSLPMYAKGAIRPSPHWSVMLLVTTQPQFHNLCKMPCRLQTASRQGVSYTMYFEFMVTLPKRSIFDSQICGLNSWVSLNPFSHHYNFQWARQLEWGAKNSSWRPQTSARTPAPAQRKDWNGRLYKIIIVLCYKEYNIILMPK